MTLFRSDRERGLWLSALAVVAAIYLTLGLAGRLAETLRSDAIRGWAFGLGFLTVVVALVGGALRRGRSRHELWVWLGIVAVYGMVLVRMGVTAEERTHLFEYGLVAVLVHEAIVERRRHGGRVRLGALAAIVLTGTLGWLDEAIQHLLPNRTYELRDVGFNVLAGIMAVSATSALRWARTWRGRGSATA